MITEALLDRCARGDAKAQYALYRLLHPAMMAICARYERDRQNAASTMNQGLLKIFSNLGKRPADVPFDPWARRIMINTVIDRFRRAKNTIESRSIDAEPDDASMTEANGYLQQMHADDFADLLLRLPPVSRNVFNLFAIDGYSHAEIATLLGISEGTSKWHVHHARTTLQRALLQRAAQRTLKPSLP